MTPACGRTTDGTGDPAALGLRLFLAPRRRHAQFEVPYDGAASLVHVVQSLGIPLTEVGAATIDGVRSVPSVSPRPGAVIELEPPSGPCQGSWTAPRRFAGQAAALAWWSVSASAGVR
jgi:hypothetical protein